MKRRKFLQHSAKGVLLPSLINGMGARAFASSPMIRALYNDLVDTDRVMVLIYLGGGNDGLNTVVPLDQYDKLANVRGNVIIAQNQLLALDGVDNVRLHPSLTSFRDLYNDGNLGIIQNVGYPEQDFSHFRSTDIWMTGSDANEVVSTGWAGRYLQTEYPNYPLDYPNDIMPDPLAIEVGYDASVMFQGPASSMGMIVGDPNYFYELINNTNEGAPDTKPGRKLDFIRLIKRQSQVYGQVIKEAADKVTSQGFYPEDNDLAQQLKIVARLIAGGLKTRLYMVSHHGFDTHDSQVQWNDHSKGEHANLLTQLSTAVGSFTDDLKGLGVSERVVGATFSEFGRRIISNASNGTDHGAAAPMFVFGEGVSGGIFGENPSIPSGAGWDDNVEMQFDFRQIYSTIFRDWFCVEQTEMNAIFDHQFDSMPLFKDSPCLSTSVHEANQQAGSSYLTNYPNPFSQETTVEFESFGGHIKVDLHDLGGAHLKTIVNGKYTKGKHTVNLDAATFPAGTYYLRIYSKYYRQARVLLKVGH